MDTQTYNNLQSGNYAKLVQQNKEMQTELAKKERIIKVLKDCLVKQFNQETKTKQSMAENINAKANCIIKLHNDIKIINKMIKLMNQTIIELKALNE